MSSKYKLGDEPVPGYRLQEFLGRGGFGEVWRARAPGGTETALKIISLSGKQGLKEFQALRLVKRIRHPNLVPIVAYWLKDDSGQVLDEAAEAELEQLRTSMAAEMLQGTLTAQPRLTARPVELVIAMGLGEQDLFHRLEECLREGLTGIPSKELLGYMEDAARAIDYLNSPRHNLGAGLAAVQHCDIKPFNIMIVGGAAQVCDFGLARMLGDVRKTATAAGTIAYVAPECLIRNEPSSATDQYSLAVTYVELKTGRLPYRSEVYTEVVGAILESRLDLGMLPEAEQAVIRRATSLDPAARYPTALDMVQDLKRAAHDGRAAAASRPARRRRSPAGIGVLLASAAAVAAAVWFWPREGYVDPNPPSKNGNGEKEENGEIVPKNGEIVPANGQVVHNGGENGNNNEAAEQAAIGEAQAAVKRGKQLFEAGDFSRAIAEFETAIARAPPEATAILYTAYLFRGTCYLEQREYQRAEADLGKAIELDALDPRGYSRRGTARLQRQDWTGAVEDFEQAVELVPDIVDYINLAVVYHSQDNRAKAKETLEQAVEFDPGSAEAHYMLAVILVEQEEFKIAIPHATEALRLGFDQPAKAHKLRAKAAANIEGEQDLALLDDKIAELLPQIERDPAKLKEKAEVAWLLATSADERVRDSNRALKLASEVCSSPGGRTALFLDALAAAQAADGDFAAAKKTAEEAVALAENPYKADYQSRLELYRAGKPYVSP